MDRFKNYLLGGKPKHGERSSRRDPWEERDPWMSSPRDEYTFPGSKDVKAQVSASASIYRVELGPKNEETGEQKCHSLLKIPSGLTKVEALDKRRMLSDIASASEKERNASVHATYNICMFEVSDSIKRHWVKFVHYWNDNVKDHIDGPIDVFVFDYRMRHVNQKPNLSEGYFLGYHSVLDKAFAQVSHVVRSCPHQHVRVFLLTNSHGIDRDKNFMSALRSIPLKEKRIDLYHIGTGEKYPAEMTYGLRAKLHSGPASIPVIFFAERPDDVHEQCRALANAIQPAMRINLNIPAKLMPTLTEKSTAYSGEYLYVEMDPETLKSTLSLVCEDESKYKYETDWRKPAIERCEYSRDYDDYHGRDERMYFRMMMMDRHRRPDSDKRRFMRRGGFDDDFFMDEEMDEELIEEYSFRYGMDPETFRKKQKMEPKKPAGNPVLGKKAFIPIESHIYSLSPRQLLDMVFKLWASCIKEKSFSTEKVDQSIYEIMKKIFHHYVDDEITRKSKHFNEVVQKRQGRKAKGTFITEFKAFVKGIKDTADITSKNNAGKGDAFSRRYGSRVKVYGADKQWPEDMEKFMIEYRKIKDQICSLPAPSPEDSCKALKSSFISDLQNDKNLNQLAQSGKLPFLNKMTITGIPVFCPLKSLKKKNPWTIEIEHAVKSPFEIASQRSLDYDQCKTYNRDNAEDAIYFDERKYESKFNIVVPIVPREYTLLLKPLLTSNLFATACSYCILKNPVINRNCHLAFLGAVWMGCVKDFPVASRPDYVHNRILNIDANAKIYLEEKRFAAYTDCLLSLPHQALQTVSKEPFDDVKLKCESLLKPCFILHLVKDDADLLKKHKADILKIIEAVLVEFLGRCLINYKSKFPFMDFLLPKVNDSDKNWWLKEKCDDIYTRMGVTGMELFKKYPDLYQINRFIKKYLKEYVKDFKKDLSFHDLVGDDAMDWSVYDGVLSRVSRYSSDEYYRGTDSEMDDDDDDDEPRAYDAEHNAEPMFDEKEVFKPKYRMLRPNNQKIEKLTHAGSAGIDWKVLKAWAQEILTDFGPAFLTKEDVDGAFSNDKVMLYLYYALRQHPSGKRQITQLMQIQEARIKIEEIITEEWKNQVMSELRPLLEKRARDDWIIHYRMAHARLAMPLPRSEIIRLAQEKKIPVDDDNFGVVYKRFDHKKGLCRNACQVQQCPWFLVPNKSMHAHLEVEREDKAYPHTLHMVVSRNPSATTKTSTEDLQCARLCGTHGRKKKYISDPTDAVKRYVSQLKRNYTYINEPED